jgi:hypothetical protein
MTKSAIIHVRTTEDRKNAIIEAAKKHEGYTQTRIVEEGIDLLLKAKMMSSRKGKK